MPTAQSRWLLEQWVFWSGNLLPIAGGVYDQPNIILDAMTVIRATKARLAAEKRRQS